MVNVSQEFGGGAFLSNTTGNFSSYGNGTGLSYMFNTNTLSSGVLSYWYNSTVAAPGAIFTIRSNYKGRGVTSIFGTTTPGSNVITNMDTTTGVLVGSTISGATIQFNTRVTSVDALNRRVTMSSPALGTIKSYYIDFIQFGASQYPILLQALHTGAQYLQVTIGDGTTNSSGLANQAVFTSPMPILRYDGHWHNVQIVWNMAALSNTPRFLIVMTDNDLPNAMLPVFDPFRQPVTFASTIPYTNPGTFFFVGGDVDSPFTYPIADSTYTGMLAELWFCPFNTAIGPSKSSSLITGVPYTPTGIGSDQGAEIGAGLVWYSVREQKLYAGKIGPDGSDLILPYPNTAQMPVVYLSARDGKLFHSNHSTNPGMASTAFKVNRPITGTTYQPGSSEPPFK